MTTVVLFLAQYSVNVERKINKQLISRVFNKKMEISVIESISLSCSFFHRRYGCHNPSLVPK